MKRNRLAVKAKWNNHKGFRRWFSYDDCEEMIGDGQYYRAITLFGLSFIVFDTTW